MGNRDLLDKITCAYEILERAIADAKAEADGEGGDG